LNLNEKIKYSDRHVLVSCDAYMERCLSSEVKFNIVRKRGLNPLLLKVRGPYKIKFMSRDQLQCFIIVEG